MFLRTIISVLKSDGVVEVVLVLMLGRKLLVLGDCCQEICLFDYRY